MRWRKHFFFSRKFTVNIYYIVWSIILPWEGESPYRVDYEEKKTCNVELQVTKVPKLALSQTKDNREMKLIKENENVY